MNICIFAKGLPVHITGGMEIHVQELARGLVKRGHKVTIITGPHPKGIEKEEDQNLRIYYLKNKPRYTRERFYRESTKLFEELNKKEKFDVIHSQSTLACGYAKYCKKTTPLILTSHGTALNEIKTTLQGESSIKSFLAIPIYLKGYLLDDPIIFKKADKIIAVSNELREDIKRQYKVPEEKLTVIPNGIDVKRFNPMNANELRKRLGIEGKVILSVGALTRQKGHHLLIKILPEILKEVRDVKLVIVGSGKYSQELEKMAIKFGVKENVIFAGKVSDEDLPKYYNLADVFAFPTLRIEAFGLVVVETMACETPVIASRIGGIPTVIENDRDGFLIKPGDLKDLKDKILMLLEDEKLASKIGRNARRKVVKKFNVEKMVDDTIKVYEEVLRK